MKNEINPITPYYLEKSKKQKIEESDRLKAGFNARAERMERRKSADIS